MILGAAIIVVSGTGSSHSSPPTPAPTSTGAPATSSGWSNPAGLSRTALPDMIRSHVPAVATVSDVDLLGIADSYCSAWSREADPKTIFQKGVESGFSQEDAQLLMSLSTGALCPQFNDRVTYDAVGWHPGGATSAPPAPAAPATSVGEGTYKVGEDLEPGSYKADCVGHGYWARLRDDSGTDIIANDLKANGGPMRFTAKKGEYVEISGGCTFTKIK
ncbi:hypothetical protein M8542_41430 [Amycolatopsis sp. OK19-0408]|uniref:DUF732 domain-containing protein n=2 Tax=Amycolatopsis iheyensis TaxID=2945988 RepID=A0A9X2NK14_9PSEU|nr:hypothetical protein [Amycolatopsis iheyensis]